MLLSLTVRDFAIIDNLTLDFKSGMTALTGETGAGKSLIIDAIGLLFGDRASNDLVRFGSPKALVEGVFCDCPKAALDLLPGKRKDPSELLVIRREIYQNGKSIARINGETVRLTVLAALASELGDIHTQFDAVKPIDPKNRHDFLESKAVAEELLKYEKLLKEYKRINNLYLKQQRKESLDLQKTDFLRFQAAELAKAALSVKEEEELRKELKLINNSEKIAENYNAFLSLFDRNKLNDSLYEAISYLRKNGEYDPSLIEQADRLESAYYDLTDIYTEISDKSRNIDFDPAELEAKNERLSLYSTLKRKYKKETAELKEYLEAIKKEIEEIENHDFRLRELALERERLFKATKAGAAVLTSERKKTAKILENDLKEVFPLLSLKDTVFKIVFRESDHFLPDGIDIIDFMISFNTGEPPKPINKVASGGELSRFMLAIKAVSCYKNKNKTFIFDEIDSGVNGEVAGNIARQIKDISRSNQVICVTHLPQVASAAGEQIRIFKSLSGDTRTITGVKVLTYEERVENIALMISKGKITEAGLALAREFLSGS